MGIPVHASELGTPLPGGVPAGGGRVSERLRPRGSARRGTESQRRGYASDPRADQPRRR